MSRIREERSDQPHDLVDFPPITPAADYGAPPLVEAPSAPDELAMDLEVERALGMEEADWPGSRRPSDE